MKPNLLSAQRLALAFSKEKLGSSRDLAEEGTLLAEIGF